MRRISYISTVLIATVVALVACSKEDKNNEQAQATHSLSFVASQPETKTTMSISDGIATFRWEDADLDNLHIYENKEEASYVSARFDEEILKFYVEFPGREAPEGATYDAHLNSDIRTQAPSSTTSYDGKCDVLSAKKINVPVRYNRENSVVFEREVAINKMTLKGLIPNYRITSVTLTSDKDISGVYSINEWTEKSKTLTINRNIQANSNGEVDIYFTCLPVEDAQLSVEVVIGSNSGRYSKTFAKTISFVKGQVKSFGVTVEAPNGDDEYVDLGLPSGNLWAKCNLGADSPEKVGGRYQWAGIADVTYNSTPLDSDHCPYHTGYDVSVNWTKYIPSDKASFWAGPSEVPDNKTVLDPDDDAAHVKLGGDWYTPTYEDWTELNNNKYTTRIWSELNGVKGYKIVSTISGHLGKWIFLPTIGSDNTSYNANYWSSTLYPSEPYDAWEMYYSNEFTSKTKYTNRCSGFYVRPVCKPASK